MKAPLLNFVGTPGIPHLNFEGGPRVPLLNVRGSRVPLLNFERVPGPGFWGPGVLVPILHHAGSKDLGLKVAFMFFSRKQLSV